MKQKILAALLAAMAVAAVSLAGCGATGGEASSGGADAAASPASSAAEESAPASDAAPSGSESGADADFEAKFAENPLDASYSEQADQLSTTQELVSLASTYAGLWNSEIIHAYEELLQYPDQEEVAQDQQTWDAEKDDRLAALLSEVTGEGTAAQIEKNTIAMNFYRDKAKELYRQLYARDPDYTYSYLPY